MAWQRPNLAELAVYSVLQVSHGRIWRPLEDVMRHMHIRPLDLRLEKAIARVPTRTDGFLRGCAGVGGILSAAPALLPLTLRSPVAQTEVDRQAKPQFLFTSPLPHPPPALTSGAPTLPLSGHPSSPIQ